MVHRGTRSTHSVEGSFFVDVAGAACPKMRGPPLVDRPRCHKSPGGIRCVENPPGAQSKYGPTNPGFDLDQHVAGAFVL